MSARTNRAWDPPRKYRCVRRLVITDQRVERRYERPNCFPIVSNWGFTVIEVAVVLGIIAILLGLSLVGIQYARESGRRIACQNNLHQLGIATLQFETRNRRYPRSIELIDDDDKGQRAVSPQVALLRDLEVPFSFEANYISLGDGKIGACPEVLACPSAAGGLSYRFSVGRMLTSANLEGVGILGSMRQVKSSQILDGLTNTVMISERLAGDSSGKMPTVLALAHVSSTFSQEACTMALRDRRSLNDIGRQWWKPTFHETSYDHERAPNSKWVDCQALAATNYFYQTINSRSFHAAGVLSLRADGSVSWFASTIDEGVWQALGTRDGKEAVVYSD